MHPGGSLNPTETPASQAPVVPSCYCNPPPPPNNNPSPPLPPGWTSSPEVVTAEDTTAPTNGTAEEEEEASSSTLILIIVVLILGLGVMVFLYFCKKKDDDKDKDKPDSQQKMMDQPPEEPPQDNPNVESRELPVEGQDGGPEVNPFVPAGTAGGSSPRSPRRRGRKPFGRRRDIGGGPRVVARGRMGGSSTDLIGRSNTGPTHGEMNRMGGVDSPAGYMQPVHSSPRGSRY